MACYPEILTHYVAWCGNGLPLRPVRPDDAAKFVAASRLCRAAALQFRILSSMHRLCDDPAKRLTQIDCEQHRAFVADAAAMEA